MGSGIRGRVSFWPVSKGLKKEFIKLGTTEE
jgi:hypothetical protein